MQHQGKIANAEQVDQALKRLGMPPLSVLTRPENIVRGILLDERKKTKLLKHIA